MATISIDGVDYEFTTDFDLGEARIIKRYTGLNLAQIEGHDASDPDLIAAFIHITFRRENPAATFSQLEEKTDAVKLSRLHTDEGDVGPPDGNATPDAA